MARITVVGHKNPDNDAISAAVGYAYLMNQTDPDGEYVAARLGDMPKESAWVAQTYGYEPPVPVDSIADLPVEEGERPKVILVDHNEAAQALDGLGQAELVGIVDHHRLGGLETPAPLDVTIRPWGSASTVVATLFEVRGVEMPKPIAAALLSALLTDTVILRSPTTTDVDRAMAAKLAKLVGVEAEPFGVEVIKSRGGDDGLTVEYLTSHDAKEFEFGGQRFLIAQHETVDLDGLATRIPQIREHMEAQVAREGYDTMLMLLTDIVTEGSQFLVAGKPDLVESTFDIKMAPAGVWMPGILSRKKQVAAKLIAAAS